MDSDRVEYRPGEGLRAALAGDHAGLAFRDPSGRQELRPVAPRCYWLVVPIGHLEVRDGPRIIGEPAAAGDDDGVRFGGAAGVERAVDEQLVGLPAAGDVALVGRDDMGSRACV